MSKTLNGAFAHNQNTVFVSPYLEQTSPLGMCLKAVTEPVNRDELNIASLKLTLFWLRLRIRWTLSPSVKT